MSKHEKISKINSEFWNVRDDLKGLSVEEIVDRRVSFDYSIAIENLSGDLNVGMIVRSAEIFGCSEIFIIGSKRYDRRSTVGAHNYVPIYFLETIEELPRGRAIIGVENVETAVPLATFTKDNDGENCVFVFGCEADGLSRNTLDHCDRFVVIPQTGVLRCLNVSATAAIVMYALQERMK